MAATLSRVVFLLGVVCGCLGNTYNFVVEAGQEECLIESLATYRVAFGEVSVLESPADLSVKFKVIGPKGHRHIVLDQTVHTLEEYDFRTGHTGQGRYRFCFMNPHSGPIKVGATIGEHEPFLNTDPRKDGRLAKRRDKSTKQAATDDHKDQLASLVEEVTTGISQVKASMEYLSARERTHRNTCESTNERVLWWSILKVGVLVLCAAAQIRFYHRFFAQGVHFGGDGQV